MTEPEASPWEKERFGAVAAELRAGVARAIQHAHQLAVRSQLSSELDTHDAYGHVIYPWQFELLAALAQDIPGLTARKPAGSKGSRFDLLVVGNVVIYPWRYAKDRRTHRQDARMKPISGIRRSVLSLGQQSVDRQLSIESIEVPEDELSAAYEEEVSVLQQLADRARTVVVGYASNPENGVLALGWGDLELVDDAGAIRWLHWEDLPLTDDLEPARPTAVPELSVPGDSRAGRFDNAPLDDDLGLIVRSPLSPAPTHEHIPPAATSGTEGPER